MPCTAPRNIVKRSQEKCTLKCLYMYKYGTSSCTVKNNSDHIFVVYDGVSDVQFNSVMYTPTEIRLFTPSLHTFQGRSAVAEMVVVHTSAHGGLMVCIPITLSNTLSVSAGAVLLEDIIKGTPTSKDAISLNVKDFTLDALVPKSAYYSYTGTVPFESCKESNQYQYVVFPMGELTMTFGTLKTLKSLIHSSYTKSYDGPCFYNETGTKSNGFGGDGQIYIDCQPTGEDGDIIYQEKVTASSSPRNNTKMLSAVLYFIIGFAVMYVITKVFMFMISLRQDKKE